LNAEIPDLLAGTVMTAYVVRRSSWRTSNPENCARSPLRARRASRSYPIVPTTAEAGLPGVEAIVWNGIFAPAGTPQPVLQILHREIVKAYNAPDVKKQVLDTGSEVVGDTPEQFAAFVRAESAKWSKVIRDANIKPE